MTFSIVHDLDKLSEPEKQKYADSAAIHFGLDPSLNPFDFIWMTQDTGFRKLCLYARRGTTDILREKHQISVLSLVQHDGPGYVSFTATGRNPDGRQEIAVGSCFIDGMRGEALAHAVMTAQTRALRRMTLQFAGVGILDVSEVNAPPETEQKIATPIDLAPAPIVPISNEAGKDITPVKVEFHASSVPATLPEHSGSVLVITPSPTAVAMSEAIDKLVEKAEENRQKALAKLNEETAPTPTAEPVKKTRKRRAKVDLGPSEPTVPLVGQAAPIDQPVIKHVPAVEAAIPAAEPVVIPAPAPVVEQPKAAVEAAPVKPRLTLEQVKPYRQRHFRFVEQLERAGFQASEGMGIATKMLNFAQVMFPDVSNMNYLTTEQWDKYLGTLETKLQNEGDKATIAYIEETIGL